MRFPIYVTRTQVKQLEYEVLSKDFYIYLTRHLLKQVEEAQYAEHVIGRKNRVINLSATITGAAIYTLEADDMGGYMSVEYDWHDSNFLLVFRRLSTIQFIEFACELLRNDFIKLSFLNEALDGEGASFRFIKERNSYGISVQTIEEIEDVDISTAHPNIRLLVSRMDNCLDADDYSGVLHAGASVFETLAKEVIGTPQVQDQTLGGFFEGFRKEANLPEPILQYILDTYKKRNATPLAGHGSLKEPEVSKEEAVTLAKLTRAVVKIEQTLRN